MEESNHEENFCYEPCGCIITFSAGCTGKKQNGTPAGGQTGTPSVARPASDYVGGPAGGKPAQKVEVNFERRVAAVEDGKVTLEDGTVILTDGADIAAPDGSAGKISAGDYIQGYAEGPDAAELNATAILITVL